VSTPSSPAKPKKRYPSDVEDEEWGFVAPYLTLMTLEAVQRKYDLREVFNALRYVVKTGAPWRYLPEGFPPWWVVYQQTSRWIASGCFEDIVDDLRELLRQAAGKAARPTVAILDGQTLQSTPESGARAGYDGAKKKKGSKIHVAVDSLGHLLALLVTPANEQERDQVDELCQQIQDVTGDNVELAWVDQGYTGEEAEAAAQSHGIRLEVVKLSESKKGFVLLPHRWVHTSVNAVVERSFAWKSATTKLWAGKSRFRRLVRDYERLPETVAGLHFVAFACLMLARLLASYVRGS
jgi:transposase